MKCYNKIDKIIQKKNNNNFIKIKLGKVDKIFNNKIDIRLFETLLKNIKNNISNPHYKKYNKYYDMNNVFIMNENGYELYYTNIKNIVDNYILDNGREIELNICIYKKLETIDFNIKYDYDKVVNIESIYFNKDDYLIEFNKINDKVIYYEINIIIKKNTFDINKLFTIMFN